MEAWGWLAIWLVGYVIIKSYGWPGYLRHRWLYRSLSGWLQVCLPSGLVRWLAGSAAVWLCYTAGWLIWLAGYMSGWLAVGLCGCVTGRLCGPLALQLGGCLVMRLCSYGDWFIGWNVINYLCGWFTYWGYTGGYTGTCFSVWLAIKWVVKYKIAYYMAGEIYDCLVRWFAGSVAYGYKALWQYDLLCRCCWGSISVWPAG